jgi:regulatory protein
MAFQRKSRPLDAPPLTPDEALAKLEYFCAYRDRCSQEVLDKIRELRLSKELGEQLFDVLQADRFFDDRRFTEMYVRSKFRSNQWGKVRIRMELKMRNLEPELIENAIDMLDQDEYETTVKSLLKKKLKQWEGDPLARQKAAASVIRAGFEMDLVFKLVDLLVREDLK